MNEKIMDFDAARAFAETWRSNWCKVDIDAVARNSSELQLEVVGRVPALAFVGAVSQPQVGLGGALGQGFRAVDVAEEVFVRAGGGRGWWPATGRR